MTPRPEYNSADVGGGDAPTSSSPPSSGECPPSTTTASPPEATRSMPRAMSMLEMNDVHDMVRFGEDMNALSSAEPPVAAAALLGENLRSVREGVKDGFFLDVPAAADDDDNDGFFFDDSQRSGGGADHGEDVFLPLMTASQNDPDRTVHLRPGGGGMRRVVSMASIPSTSRGLFAIAPYENGTIHPISEEEAVVMDAAWRAETTETGLDSSVNSRRSSRMRRSSSAARMKTSASQSRTPETGLDESISSRRRSSGLPRSASSASFQSANSLDGSHPSPRSRSKGNGIKTLMRRTLSSARLKGGASQDPLDDSFRDSKAQISEVVGHSVTVDSAPREPTSSNSRSRLPSRSGMKNSANNLRSSLKSTGSSSSTERRLPLRSAMKNSANNLRSSGILSNVSMDDTNHSINSSNEDGKSELSNSFKSGSPKLPRSPSSASMKRNVSFSSLEIRSYNMTLGDAPSTNGPAVGLSWDHDPEATEEHSIEKYEEFRDDQGRRSKREMHMPPSHRQYLLMRDAGLSRGEINRAMEEAQRCARQRIRTTKGVRMGLAPVEEVLERAVKGLTFKRR